MAGKRRQTVDKPARERSGSITLTQTEAADILACIQNLDLNDDTVEALQDLAGWIPCPHCGEPIDPDDLVPYKEA